MNSIFGWVWLANFWVGGSPKPLWLIAALLLMTATIIYQIFRRNDVSHPGRVQIRLSEAGCVQFDDLAAPSLVYVLLCSQGWIIPIVGEIVLIVFFLIHRLAALAFAQLTLAAILLEIGAWYLCADFRDKISSARDGSITDLNAVLYRPTPWLEVRYFSLKPISAGAYRLSIIRIPRFLFFGIDLVDAEIACTDGEAQTLREFLTLKIANSPNPRR